MVQSLFRAVGHVGAEVSGDGLPCAAIAASYRCLRSSYASRPLAVLRVQSSTMTAGYFIRQQRTTVAAIQRLGDATCVAISLYLSQWLVGQPLSDRTAVIALVAAIVFLVVGEVSGLYNQDRSQSADRELLSVVITWLSSLAVLAVCSILTRYGEQLARSSIVSWALLSTTSIGLLRMIVRVMAEMLCARGWSVRRCAIAGLNPLGKQLAENAGTNPACGLRIDGFFDDRATQRNLEELAVSQHQLGRLEELVERARSGEFDTVFITLPMRAEARIRWLLEQLGDTTANVYIIPDFFVFELLHSRWTQFGGLPSVSVFETPLYGVDGWVKRAFDLTVAFVGLIAIAPVMIVCGLLVKLSSPGPVFFRQRRYGLDGKEILVWKFRSMRTCDNGPVVVQASQGDPRITPIGRILRRTSLDELPQLFNVIEGTMSLVGPRPHASAHNERYRKLIRGYMLRHKVKPGITGLAQVEGFRGETETLDKMQKRVDCDHRYIREWSVWLDLKILCRTLLVVFKQENAY